MNAKEQYFRNEKLQFYVAHVAVDIVLNDPTLQALAPLVSYNVFKKQKIPAAHMIRGSDIFIVSNHPISSTSYETRLGGKDIKCKIVPSALRTPLAPVNPEELKAISMLWYRNAILSMSRQDNVPRGAVLDYDRTMGWLLKIDPSRMSVADFPDWVPQSERPTLLQKMNIDPRLFYSDAIESFFLDPFRYIQFSFDVHANGRPFIALPLRTRMIPPKGGYSLAKFINKIPPWWVGYMKKGQIQAYFQDPTRQRRLHPRTLTIREITSDVDPQKFQTARGTLYDSMIEDLDRIYSDSDIPLLSKKERDILRQKGKFVRVEPATLSDEQRDFFVPPHLLAPIIHQENWFLFEDIFYPQGYPHGANFSKTYFQVSTMQTELKAATIDYVKKEIMQNVDLSMTVGDAHIPIELSEAITFDDKQAGEPDKEPAFYSPVEDCLLWKLPRPLIFVRNLQNENITIYPNELYDRAAREGEVKAFKVSPLLKDCRVALIGPAKFQKTLENAKALLEFNADYFMSQPGFRKLQRRKAEGRRLGMLAWKIEMKKWFENIRRFFDEANPRVKVYPLEDFTTNSYLEKMNEAWADGHTAFVIILPKGKGNWRALSDEVYFGTYRLVAEWQARGLKAAVVHHNTDSYVPGGSYYHVLFTDWSSINNALGGKTTALKLDSVTNVFSDFPNPLFVCMDFGTPEKNIIGAVVSSGPDLDIKINLTENRITKLSDAAEGLKELLLRQVDKFAPKAVIFFKDNKITQMEKRGLFFPYRELNVPIVVVEALKSGGVSGFRLSEKARVKGGLGVTFLSGVGLLTGNMEAHIFPAERRIPTRENRYGLQTAMRYKIERTHPIDVGKAFTIKEIANIATGLAATYSYFPEPQTAKQMEIHKKAHITAKMAAAGVFDGLEGAILPAAIFS
ncbi:MAG: hypothetical protein QXZ70_00910 [Candidatus Bathyarchaeia archaeon]